MISTGVLVLIVLVGKLLALSLVGCLLGWLLWRHERDESH